MKRMFYLAVYLLVLCGCVSVKIPKYVTDQNPYKKIFHSDYGSTLTAVKESLASAGWSINEESDPIQYEQGRAGDAQQQVVLFTEGRQSSRVLYSRYRTLNVYVSNLGDRVEVEVRYLSLTPVLFKIFESRRNDPLVNALFNDMEQRLAGTLVLP